MSCKFAKGLKDDMIMMDALKFKLTMELSEVSKEVLSRKRVADRYCAKLEKTVDHLQQENEDLQKRITDMEKKHKRAKKRSRSLDRISLLG